MKNPSMHKLLMFPRTNEHTGVWHSKVYW